MRLFDFNWQQVQDYLQHDDRVVLPIGSTEQHGLLSLGTDAILAERVAVEAAEPLGLPVLPVLPFGMAPYFSAFPGSLTLRMTTYVAVVRDLLDTLSGQGFRRIAVVNGHGGNAPVLGAIREWVSEPRDHRMQVVFTSWYAAPKVAALAESHEADPTHGGWFENFPWTRLPGVAMPEGPKPHTSRDLVAQSSAADLRELLGDGSFGGSYELPDEIMTEIWRTGVAEVRELLETGWAFS
ncbi:creatinine amidohydrolase [Nakamurella sp. UYEF19]|uniref:creatininase family protein n=1 Tax=Nakamurella sp. UYEF19 TaxID=1756392 RepID=UPI00339B91FC